MSREEPIGCPLSSSAKWRHSLFPKAAVSSELETEERGNESAGTALEMKGDMQNEKYAGGYLRIFQPKLSKAFGSPLLA